MRSGPPGRVRSSRTPRRRHQLNRHPGRLGDRAGQLARRRRPPGRALSGLTGGPAVRRGGGPIRHVRSMHFRVTAGRKARPKRYWPPRSDAGIARRRPSSFADHFAPLAHLEVRFAWKLCQGVANGRPWATLGLLEGTGMPKQSLAPMANQLADREPSEPAPGHHRSPGPAGGPLRLSAPQ